MSDRWNTAKAVVLFGDRMDPADLIGDPQVSRDFRIPADREWLLALLDSVNVTAMPPVPGLDRWRPGGRKLPQTLDRVSTG